MIIVVELYFDISLLMYTFRAYKFNDLFHIIVCPVTLCCAWIVLAIPLAQLKIGPD